MTCLILFLPLLHLPSTVQQFCEVMPHIQEEFPTVQPLISPELAVAGKPLNITCIARRSATLTQPAHDVFGTTLFFQNRLVKSCGGDFDLDAAASLSCSLIVSNASVSGNSGTYICRARAGQMCTISSTVINVKDPIAPSITEAPKSQTNLTIGQELTMTCVAYGIPPPDIVWTKDNILTTLPVNTTKYQGNSTSVVRVAAVDIAQFGVYQCQANNSEGEAQSSPANITAVSSDSDEPMISTETTKIANASGRQVSDNSALIIGVGLAGFVVFYVGQQPTRCQSRSGST